MLSLRTYRERAETEAASARVEHPRLMSVHEAIVDERRGVVGLVMDFAAEGDLRNALRSGDAPRPIEMVQIADDVLAALDALHSHGLVHRDVKPENILLERIDGQRRARLGDLGIARPVDRTRSTGSVLGTDLYIAPEVHDGGAPSIAADLWAVGYVLYEGLFGAPPHADAATTYQAIGRLRAEGPDRPPNVPDAIWRVVATLLAPAPGDRPANAQQARDLVASARSVAMAASGVAIRTADLSGGAKVPRPKYESSPRGLRAAVIGSVAAVLIGGIAFANTPWARPSSDGATSIVTPMLQASAVVVASDYRWQLHEGVLSGRFEVTNRSAAPSDATKVPELFPARAADAGKLALQGYSGDTRRQSDGSLLVQFPVPPLAARASHVVSFRVTVPGGGSDKSLLAELVRDRDAALHRYALATRTTTTTVVPATTTTTVSAPTPTTTAPAPTTTTTAKKRPRQQPTTTTTAPPPTTTTQPEEVIV